MKYFYIKLRESGYTELCNYQQEVQHFQQLLKALWYSFLKRTRAATSRAWSRLAFPTDCKPAFVPILIYFSIFRAGAMAFKISFILVVLLVDGLLYEFFK